MHVKSSCTLLGKSHGGTALIHDRSFQVCLAGLAVMPALPAQASGVLSQGQEALKVLKNRKDLDSLRFPSTESRRQLQLQGLCRAGCFATHVTEFGPRGCDGCGFNVQRFVQVLGFSQPFEPWPETRSAGFALGIGQNELWL